MPFRRSGACRWDRAAWWPEPLLSNLVLTLRAGVAALRMKRGMARIRPAQSTVRADGRSAGEPGRRLPGGIGRPLTRRHRAIRASSAPAWVSRCSTRRSATPCCGPGPTARRNGRRAGPVPGAGGRHSGPEALQRRSDPVPGGAGLDKPGAPPPSRGGALQPGGTIPEFARNAQFAVGSFSMRSTVSTSIGALRTSSFRP